jgi:hypothetical protein
LIFFDIKERTGAGFFWVFVVATFAGIHGCDKHKIGGILDGSGDSGNDNRFVFEGLS